MRPLLVSFGLPGQPDGIAGADHLQQEGTVGGIEAQQLGVGEDFTDRDRRRAPAGGPARAQIMEGLPPAQTVRLQLGLGGQGGGTLAGFGLDCLQQRLLRAPLQPPAQAVTQFFTVACSCS
ncbi:hypothetical protein PZA18_08820 [Chitinimonas sp. DQS-5]|uniref:Uncharacterized protein n=1 Tax=Parachitinimonas caeni TaxID=3031301 RepID=A0ABT7DYL8_9NEIS|nr:hypothetical protein [Parachitinimonas caeni]MDK2124148.1 hypothetical protein [Parachitinimonas caeni]